MNTEGNNISKIELGVSGSWTEGTGQDSEVLIPQMTKGIDAHGHTLPTTRCIELYCVPCLGNPWDQR